MKKQKNLLSLLTPLSIIGGLILSACANTQLPFERNEVFIQKNIDPASNKIFDFGEDYSVFPTSFTQKSLLLVPGLAKIAYSDNGASIVNDKGEVQNNQHSQQKFSLSFAKSIHITKSDDNVVVYDNDKADKAEKNVVYTSTQKLLSSDPNSINNPQFYKDLAHAKKLQITVRDDVYYVDYQGKKTKYKVLVEDFYTSYARAVLEESAFRKSNGGSDAADKAALEKYKDKLNPASQRFTRDGYFQNEYLFSIFNVDSQKLRSKSNFIHKIKGTNEDAITLEAVMSNSVKTTDTSKDNTKQPRIGAQFDDFWDKMVIGATYFNPTPTQFIKDNNESKNFNNVTNLAKDTGYYWYGQKSDEMLYAGTYTLSKNKLDQTVFTANPHYLDQTWFNNSKKIKSVVYQYVGSDTSVFETNEFELYKNGSLFNLLFQSLNQERQVEVLTSKNQEQFNVNYAIPIDRDSFFDFSFVTNFYVNPQSQTNDKYYYNDAVSYLMYGDTIENLKKGTNKDVNKYYWTGDGLIFRSLLSNAFNLYQYIQSINDKASIWLPNARPSNLISGSDKATATIKTLANDAKNQNTIFAFDDKYEKIVKDLDKDRDWTQKYFKDNNQAILSSSFEKLKEAMKNLLDKKLSDSDPTGKALKEKKLEATIITRFSNPSKKSEAAYSNVINAINALDKRINFKYEKRNPVTNTDVLLKNRAIVGSKGWNYDYDGYGGYLGYFFYITDNPLFTALLPFYEDSTSSTVEKAEKENKTGLDNKLKSAFPEVVKLAKAYKEEAALFPTGAKTFDDLKKATNKDWSSGVDKFIKGTAQNFDPVGAYAKFAFNYQNKTTNANLAKLNAELTSLIGVNGIYSKLLTDTKPSPLLFNRHYLVPTFITQYFDFQYVYVK